MKFTDKDLTIHSLIKTEDIGICNICNEPTEYIEYCYEVRCCGDECLSELDNQYKKDYERMDKDLYNNDI